jgi:hypothetical protein
VHVEERAIPQDLLGGDYLGDCAFRERFQAWIEGLWSEKDQRLEKLLAEHETRRTDERDGPNWELGSSS